MATPRGPARRGRAAAPARPPGDEVDAPPVGRVPPAPAAGPVPRRAPTRTIVTGEDGRRGVFVSLEAADLATDLPAPELARMIEALQGELAKRDAEIAALRQQIGELLAPPQTLDDFSAALQSTVDELQTEDSATSRTRWPTLPSRSSASTREWGQDHAAGNGGVSLFSASVLENRRRYSIRQEQSM